MTLCQEAFESVSVSINLQFPIESLLPSTAVVSNVAIATNAHYIWQF